MDNCLLEPRKSYNVDFGECFAFESRKRTVDIVNTGDFNIDFIISKKPHPSVSVIPENGTVKKNEHCIVEISFLSNVSLQLNTSL